MNTGDIVLEKYDTNLFGGLDGFDSTGNQPEAERAVLDIVRVFRTNYDGKSTAVIGFEASTEPLVIIHISSVAIINAFRSIVKYYPSQDLIGDTVTVPYPFVVLVHHFDELCAFQRLCCEKDPKDLCIRERNAHQHIGALIDFLERNVMEKVREEKKRHRKGFETWDWWWVRMKPGETWFHSTTDSKDPYAGVVRSIVGGTTRSPPIPWLITSDPKPHNPNLQAAVKAHFSLLEKNKTCQTTQVLQTISRRLFALTLHLFDLRPNTRPKWLLLCSPVSASPRFSGCKIATPSPPRRASPMRSRRTPEMELSPFPRRPMRLAVPWVLP